MAKFTLAFLLFVSIPVLGQNKSETIANFGLRAADASQTCYYMSQGHWHEAGLPTQSCAGVVGFSAGLAVGAYFADRWLEKHNHPRLAHFQLVSASGVGVGIAFNFAHKR